MVAVTTNPGDLVLCALIVAGIATQLRAGRRRYQRPEARHPPGHARPAPGQRQRQRPAHPARTVTAVLQRILARTELVPPPEGKEHLGPCRLWLGATCKGYGQVRHAGKVHRVHRLVWQLRHGPVPDGRELDHTCERKLCVDHTEPVTHAENLRRLHHGR